MRLLLDTQVLLWWLDDHPDLTVPARSVITDVRNQLFVSAASAWEISIKQSTGKLRTEADIEAVLGDADVQALPISLGHGFAAGALPKHHRDPFDRLLVAQARIERLTILTVDEVFRRYDVDVMNA